MQNSISGRSASADQSTRLRANSGSGPVDTPYRRSVGKLWQSAQTWLYLHIYGIVEVRAPHVRVFTCSTHIELRLSTEGNVLPGPLGAHHAGRRRARICPLDGSLVSLRMTACRRTRLYWTKNNPAKFIKISVKTAILGYCGEGAPCSGPSQGIGCGFRVCCRVARLRRVRGRLSAFQVQNHAPLSSRSLGASPGSM